MANYVNLTLDTIGPSGVSVIINNDETKTISTSVNLSVSCSDADLTDYQMKIWGTSAAATEEDAVWETYQATKNITLPEGDGIKTVYVKVRDDVWNESATVSDTITLYMKAPAILGFNVSRSRLSLVNGKNITMGTFGVDESISAFRVMLVNDVNASYNDPSNLSIPTANGSYFETDDHIINTSGYLEGEEFIDSVHGMMFSLNAADIAAVSPGDGVKIIKVFVRSAESGNWSV